MAVVVDRLGVEQAVLVLTVVLRAAVEYIQMVVQRQQIQVAAVAAVVGRMAQAAAAARALSSCVITAHKPHRAGW